MTIQTTKLTPYISKDTRAIEPECVQKSNTLSYPQPNIEVLVAADASDSSINIGDKTIKALLLAVDNGVSTISVTVTIGGNSQTLNVNELLTITDNVTALTVSNSDSDNARNLYVSIIAQ